MPPSSSIRVLAGAAAVLLGIGACAESGTEPRAAAVVLRARPVVQCSECWPAAFAFTPNGKQVFYLERFSGEIHRSTPRTGADAVWGSVGPVEGGGERGALGIALDPRWDRGKGARRLRNRSVYVFYTHASPVENRIVRLRRTREGRVREEQLVSIGIDVGTNHNAGPMRFGPDGKLYVVTGDQAEEARSQDLADPAGKVLRLNPNGSRPDDNPFPGSLAFSIGHRNSFGFGFDPATGDLWQTENGPQCDDEVNLVRRGGNYGWGAGSDCPNTSTVGPSPRAPEHEWTPPIVPTGAAFCSRCGLGAELEGDLLVGVYSTGEILNLSVDAERDDVTAEGVAYEHTSGILAVERRPDGRVYFSDSNGIYLLAP